MIYSLKTHALRLASAGSLAALALVAAQPAYADEEPAASETAMTEGEARLAKLLEGRVAGEPQNCIRTRPNYRLTVIDDTAYVYGSGRTIYVQRTQNPHHIDDTDTLVSRRFTSSEICRQDIVTTIDPVLGFFTGTVFFDDFVPYTRVEENEEG
ncbi:hypothetical protein [Qipengyuania sp. ASV99]|uniref:hypothetical protein n=1 Tax=Qipengyuania sp. ASV99 TaxID=3399681 RepID=UPI003A4C64E2